jgi:hypothetical protein
MPKPWISACLILAFVGAPVLLAGGLGTATPAGPSYEGDEVAVDLPEQMRVRNTVGIDGQGLCVWASIEMMARYHNEESLIGIFKQMQSEKGGGWPERVDREMRKRGLENRYRQFYGPAAEGADFVSEALAAGRGVCVTYGYGEFYGNRTISHMVFGVQLDAKHGAVLDNNDPNRIWWMEPAEMIRRAVHPGGDMWALYLLAPAPPPAPHN